MRTSFSPGLGLACFAVALIFPLSVARAAEDEGDPVTEPVTGGVLGILPFRAVVFSPDDKLIATTGGKDGYLREFSVWNAGTWDKRFSYQAQRTQRTLAFSPDSKQVTVGIFDGKLTSLDAATGKVAKAVDNPDKNADRIELSPSGKLLAIANRKDFNITLWDVASMQARGVLSGHKKYIESLAYSPDGKMLVSCGSDHEAILWNVEKATKIRSLATGNRSARSVVFSPNGKLVAIGCNDADVRVYETRNGARFTKFEPPNRAPAQEMAFTRDNRFLAIAGAAEVTIFLVEKSVVKPEELQRANQFIAQLDDDNFTVRDRATKELAKLGTAVAPALNSALTNATSDEVRRRIRSVLGSLQAPKPHKILSGHRGQIDGLAFSNDGKLLATASNDATVRIWDTSTGETIATLDPAQDPSE
jgi:WD40 repeat protein